jgi:hypothetical protein
MTRRSRPALVLLVALAALMAWPASAPAENNQALLPPSEQLTKPPSQTKPPPGYRLSARQAIQIAAASQRLRDKLDPKYTGLRPSPFLKGTDRWQVSFYAIEPDGEHKGEQAEVAQVVVDDRTGKVDEVWTGPQVRWWMARGLAGSFGRKVNAPYVWIPLMFAFIVPFLDFRRPFRLLHLDLLALLAFSLSHLYFNKGEIFTSVPLVYPVLGYLLMRMLLFVYVSGFANEDKPVRPLVPATYLAMALVLLLGFRVGLNLTSSNVIDVGYSGVIGADRLAHGEGIYGNFPDDNLYGDTYGPFNYIAYVPFELVLPWHGKWDALPAAHAAALFFDLITILGLFLVGRRMRPGKRGQELGVMLAYAWAAFPYTLFVLNTNANDSLLAALLVYSFLFLSSSRMRGALLALAGMTKFAPLALGPLYLSYSRRLKTALRFVASFAVVTLIVMLPVLINDSLSQFWDRTVGFQLGRESPFSIWGQETGLEWLQTIAKVLAAGLAVLVAFVPRRKTPLQLAALAAAVLIALQFTLEHWFYLYIVWFFPFVLIALLGDEPETVDGEASGHRQHDELDRAREPAVA